MIGDKVWRGVSTRERFEGKVHPEALSGCHLWHGAVNKRGYGNFLIGRESRKAHRVAYEMYVGPIPDGLLVCHRCDVPCCVNPDHLFLGTDLDNNRDRHAKGRTLLPSEKARGEAQALAVLTEEAVRDIRQSAESGGVLGARYGVSRTAIFNVKKRATWKHIDGGTP